MPFSNTSNIIAAQDARSQPGRITFLRPSVEFTQRTLSCPGEALTLTCSSSGSGITWTSEPSLSMPGDQEIHGFEHNASPGSCHCYPLNYTGGTAFFVSVVLQNVVPGGDCNSSITLVPIPNDEGQYPTSFAPNGLFNITCTAGSTAPRIERTQSWVYRVAGMLIQLSYAHATLTYFTSYFITAGMIYRVQ